MLIFLGKTQGPAAGFSSSPLSGGGSFALFSMSYVEQTWRETSSLEKNAPGFASTSVPQFPQLFKRIPGSWPGTVYPKHFQVP